MNNSIKNVANKLQLNENQINTVLDLLREGATVPFIARYRQAQTGGLNEEIIQQIDDLYQYDVELNKRKEAIITILKEAKLLTPEIEQKLLVAETKAEVENIYEPFKVGKKTKASDAIALGLEPLAKAIFEANDDKFSPFNEAKKYLNDKVPTVEFAIEQAQFIISQWISQDVETREYVKQQIFNFGTIETKKKKNDNDPEEVFAIYYEHSERVNRIPNHRILAISRAEERKVISYDIKFNENTIKYELNNKFFKIKRTGTIIYNSLTDALDRLIYPSIIREIKNDLFDKAEKEAIKIFAEQVESMLMWPAVKGKKILAIDPGFGHGCKMAVLNENGDLREVLKMYPNAPQNEFNRSKEIVNKILDKYDIDIIVIGNGTASRETEEFVAKVLKERKGKYIDEHIGYSIVSEIGASVYSASESANKEFPKLSVEERSAVNIGRRYQDPLNELVKIDPKSIGVGQYQHDLNQKELNKALDFKVNKVVNLVGIDLNSATIDILQHVSGLTKKTAENIVEYRKVNNKFLDREQLKKVKGLGEKAYEQCVGFLRIYDSKNFFDKTSVHPENYQLAYKIVELLNIDLSDIDIATLEKINQEELAEKLNSNIYDVKQIIEALINPTKDIRSNKEGYKIKEDILKIEDLQTGMVVDGTILNITDFAIFAYIGLKQTAFIHVSKITKDNKKINNVYDHFHPGDTINIEIIEINQAKEQVKGSIKL
ncbi:helix-hairpin-helix domain-containing protein [Mycoplasmopsis iners]|uniref:helix-hairpin-helix domain-containing protein n=1 Tax=Mycoplasmopsis iners TaxID=76630 RepID=UPI000495E041|nr:Tex-like N-terminal domain-containing protein [Mycoplasmopsis iners]